MCSPLVASNRVVSCDVALQNLRISVSEFNMRCGRLPIEQEGLRSLVEQPAGWPSEKPWEPLLRVLPKDPWGHEYDYLVTPGRNEGFGIYSLGADGITLSDGNDSDDLNTWDEKRPWLAYYGVGSGRKNPLRYLIPIIAAIVITTIMFVCQQKEA